MSAIIQLAYKNIIPYINYNRLVKQRWSGFKDNRANYFHKKIKEIEAMLIDHMEGKPFSSIIYTVDSFQKTDKRVKIKNIIIQFPDNNKNNPLFDLIESDKIGFYALTAGNKSTGLLTSLYEQNRYESYFLLAGYLEEITESSANYLQMFLNSQFKNEYSLRRFSFGYPNCPDLTQHKPLNLLLDFSKINLSLSSSCELLPIHSSTGFFIFSPVKKSNNAKIKGDKNDFNL